MWSDSTRRLCARPGCARVAGAAVIVDPGALTVIFTRSSDTAMGAVLLCDMHQRRVAVPDGWIVRDERIEAHEPVPEDRSPITPSPSIDDASPPLLRRAFRAASPGSALDRKPRGLSWLEGLHHEVDSSPEHAAERMDDDGQRDADGDGDDEDGYDGEVGRREHRADRDRAHQSDRGDDRVHPDGADEVALLTLEDEAAAGTAFGHLQPAAEDLVLPADGAVSQQRSADERPPGRRRRGIGHGAQRMDNLTLFPDTVDVALGA